MIYKAFQDLHLSQLGFGTMRLPLREDKSMTPSRALIPVRCWSKALGKQ